MTALPGMASETQAAVPVDEHIREGRQTELLTRAVLGSRVRALMVVPSKLEPSIAGMTNGAGKLPDVTEPKDVAARLARLEQIAELQIKVLNSQEAAIHHARAEIKALESASGALLRILANHEDPEINNVLPAIGILERVARQTKAADATIALLRRLLKQLRCSDQE
jgi:hypothetical protein